MLQVLADESATLDMMTFQDFPDSDTPIEGDQAFNDWMENYSEYVSIVR